MCIRKNEDNEIMASLDAIVLLNKNLESLQADAAEEKVRAVLFKDERQICPGRGLYVCADEACVEKFLQFRAGGRKRKGVSA